MQLKVKRLDPSVATLPTRAHANDAGLDLYASVNVEIPPGETRLVMTGLAIELPAGTEAQVRPRSGLALKHNVTVLNAPGTIDEGYRGPVKTPPTDLGAVGDKIGVSVPFFLGKGLGGL